MRFISKFIYIPFLIYFFILTFNVKAQEAFKPGTQVGSFTLQNLYTAGPEKTIGSRWQHSTGFTVHVLQFDTVPQSAIWIGTPPVSDEGHSHALEHVLLGKSKKGRFADIQETYALGSSGALTYQMYTQYNFKTKGGMPEYYKILAAKYDALFDADLDDHHIQQELYHYAVKGNKKLNLVESGTVYQEMQSYEKAYADYYGSIKMILGDHHPYVQNSGGDPQAIRTLKPEDIRSYYKKHYRIGSNVSMLSFLPSQTNLEQYFMQLENIVKNLPKQTDEPKTSFRVEAKRSLKNRIVDIPFASHQKGASAKLRIVWDLAEVSYEQEFQFSFFLAALNKYLEEKYIKSKKLPLEFINCYMYRVDKKQVYPNCYAQLKQDNANTKNIRAVQKELSSSIKRLMNIQSEPELLNKYYGTAQANLEGMALQYKTVFDYVPDDSAIESWKEVFQQLNHNGGFKQDAFFTQRRNKSYSDFLNKKAVWQESIKQSGILKKPYIVKGLPSLSIGQAVQESKKKRKQSKIQSLQKEYKTENVQAALKQFLNEQKKKEKPFEYSNYPEFPKRYAFSPDPNLDYKHYHKHKVEYVETYFKHKNSLDLDILLRMTEIPKEYHLYLGALSYLIKRVGLYKNGKRSSYQDLADSWYKKGISMSYGYAYHNDHNYFNMELSVSDMKHLQEALQALEDNLLHANFTKENLKEIRYQVEKGLSASESFTRSPGDSWVPSFLRQTRDAIKNRKLKYRRENYFSQRFDDYHLSWLLADPLDEKTFVQAQRYFKQLNEKKLSKDKLLLELKKTNEQKDIKALADNLYFVLEQVPQENLQEDFETAVSTMLKALQTPVQKTLDNFKQTLSYLRSHKKIRIVMASSKENIQKTHSYLNEFLRKNLNKAKFVRKTKTKRKKDELSYFLKRMQSRYPQINKDYPKHIFFATPNKTNSNVRFRSYAPGLEDLKQKEMFEYLSGLMFAGSGPKSFFYNTWQSGLAYSNGLRADPDSYKLSYAAYRVGDLEALLSYVEGLSKQSEGFDQKDLDLLVATYFNDLLRTDMSLSSRAWEQALDIFYKDTSKRYRKHAKKVLKLRNKKKTIDKLKQAWQKTWIKIWPFSNDLKVQKENKNIFLYVGTEKDFEMIQAKLPNQTVYKVYPRDFWFVDEQQ